MFAMFWRRPVPPWNSEPGREYRYSSLQMGTGKPLFKSSRCPTVGPARRRTRGSTRPSSRRSRTSWRKSPRPPRPSCVPVSPPSARSTFRSPSARTEGSNVPPDVFRSSSVRASPLDNLFITARGNRGPLGVWIARCAFSAGPGGGRAHRAYHHGARAPDGRARVPSRVRRRPHRVGRISSRIAPHPHLPPAIRIPRAPLPPFSLFPRWGPPSNFHSKSRR